MPNSVQGVDTKRSLSPRFFPVRSIWECAEFWSRVFWADFQIFEAVSWQLSTLNGTSYVTGNRFRCPICLLSSSVSLRCLARHHRRWQRTCTSQLSLTLSLFLRLSARHSCPSAGASLMLLCRIFYATVAFVHVTIRIYGERRRLLVRSSKTRSLCPLVVSCCRTTLHDCWVFSHLHLSGFIALCICRGHASSLGFLSYLLLGTVYHLLTVLNPLFLLFLSLCLYFTWREGLKVYLWNRKLS